MANDLRIVYVTHYTDLYGANRSLLNLIDGLLKKGIDNLLVVVPSHGAICAELEKKGVAYSVIPFVNETFYATNGEPGFIKKIGKFCYNWYIVFKNSKRLKKQNRCIIHSNSSATLIGAYFARWLGISHVWHIREFGKEDYNYAYNFGYSYFDTCLNRSSGVIAISNAIYNKRVKHTNVDLKKVINNGVVFSCEMEKTYLSPKKNEEIIFGIIGVISEEKGQIDAIDAFSLFEKKNENSRLLIAGTGTESYINLLERKVQNYKLEGKVVFAGFVEDTRVFYKKIHCLLMCSKNEGLGRVTIEAMSYGIPVIGYDNAGTSEIIINNYNGLLYKNGYKQLSEMMLIFAENENLQKTFSDNAFNTVKQKFTIEAYTANVCDMYNSIVNK